MLKTPLAEARLEVSQAEVSWERLCIGAASAMHACPMHKQSCAPHIGGQSMIFWLPAKLKSQVSYGTMSLEANIQQFQQLNQIVCVQ